MSFYLLMNGAIKDTDVLKELEKSLIKFNTLNSEELEKLDKNITTLSKYFIINIMENSNFLNIVGEIEDNPSIYKKRVCKLITNICRFVDDNITDNVIKYKIKIYLMMNSMESFFRCLNPKCFMKYLEVRKKIINKIIDIDSGLKTNAMQGVNTFNKNISQRESLMNELNKCTKEYEKNIIGLTELKEMLNYDETTFDINLNFNFEEFKKLVQRLLKNGEYKDLKAKEKAINKILGLENIKEQIQFNKTDIMVLNKDIVNNDFSIRQDLILKAMSQYGDKKNPVVITNEQNITISKYGLACDSSDKALFDFLLGQFVENGCESTKFIARSDLFEALKYDGKGSRFKALSDSLNTIGTQMIMIDDTMAKDKMTKQIAKNISKEGRDTLRKTWINLFLVEHFEKDGQMYIEFSIPLMKYFCSHKQFDRLISTDIMKYWRSSTRIYWIARELAVLSRNKNNVLKVSTLLKNINEWDRYKKYADKNKFLQRFYSDFEKAKAYLKTNKEIVFNGCSPSTLLESRIICK